MAWPQYVWDVLRKRGRVTLRGEEVTRAAAKESVTLAKKLPRKPGVYERGLAKSMKASRARLFARPAARRIIVDAADVSKALGAGKAVRRQKKLSALVEGLSANDWSELLLKLKNRYAEKVTKRVSAVKGLFFELWVRRLPEFEQLLARSERRIKQSGEAWHGKPFVVRGATTIGDSRELADYLVVTFDNVENPKKMWVLAVVESKSEHNAISIVYHKEFGGIPGRLDPRLGEALGQPQQVVERSKEFGIDLGPATIEGWKGRKRPSQFGPDRSHLKILHEGKRPLGEQTTELIGVIPPDTPAEQLKTIEKVTKERKMRLWYHSVKGSEADALAKEAIVAFEGAKDAP